MCYGQYENYFLSQGSDAGTIPRGGFGEPQRGPAEGLSAHKKKEPHKTYKRASDIREDAETRPLNIGDFQMAIVRGHTDRVKQYMDLGRVKQLVCIHL